MCTKWKWAWNYNGWQFKKFFLILVALLQKGARKILLLFHIGTMLSSTITIITWLNRNMKEETNTQVYLYCAFYMYHITWMDGERQLFGLMSLWLSIQHDDNGSVKNIFKLQTSITFVTDMKAAVWRLNGASYKASDVMMINYLFEKYSII